MGEPGAGAGAGAGRQRPATKISFGVIVARINADTRRPEAVLVRGRYSYEFAEFVLGRYSRKNTRAVSALFAAMSVNERLDIYSLNFSQIWYRIWLTAGRQELYNNKFAKFQASWLRDDSGVLLRRLLQTSAPPRHDGGIRLDFPKGRRLSPREPDLNCAVRETEEETGISKRDYQILPGFKRRVSFVNTGVCYTVVYYVAIARRDLRVGVDFCDLKQVSEVAEVRWMDIEQIRLFDGGRPGAPGRLETTIAPVFRHVKRYVRGRAGPPRGLGFLRQVAPPPPRREVAKLATRENRLVGTAPGPSGPSGPSGQSDQSGPSAARELRGRARNRGARTRGRGARTRVRHTRGDGGDPATQHWQETGRVTRAGRG